MKEEVMKLTEDASNLINDFEEYIFENSKEQYIGAKPILDQNKETIELINDSIDSVDLESTKTNLENIINAINDAKKQLDGEDNTEEEIINNAAPLVDEYLFKEEAIENTIETVNNSFESINFNDDIDPFNQEIIEGPSEVISEQNIEPEVTPEIIFDDEASAQETEVNQDNNEANSDELDIAAIDEFLANNSFDFE